MIVALDGDRLWRNAAGGAGTGRGIPRRNSFVDGQAHWSCRGIGQAFGEHNALFVQLLDDARLLSARQGLAV